MEKCRSHSSTCSHSPSSTSSTWHGGRKQASCTSTVEVSFPCCGHWHIKRVTGTDKEQQAKKHTKEQKLFCTDLLKKEHKNTINNTNLFAWSWVKFIFYSPWNRSVLSRQMKYTAFTRKPWSDGTHSFRSDTRNVTTPPFLLHNRSDANRLMGSAVLQPVAVFSTSDWVLPHKASQRATAEIRLHTHGAQKQFSQQN